MIGSFIVIALYALFTVTDVICYYYSKYPERLLGGRYWVAIPGVGIFTLIRFGIRRSDG